MNDSLRQGIALRCLLQLVPAAEDTLDRDRFGRCTAFAYAG